MRSSPEGVCGNEGKGLKIMKNENLKMQPSLPKQANATQLKCRTF